MGSKKQGRPTAPVGKLFDLLSFVGKEKGWGGGGGGSRIFANTRGGRHNTTNTHCHLVSHATIFSSKTALHVKFIPRSIIGPPVSKIERGYVTRDFGSNNNIHCFIFAHILDCILQPYLLTKTSALAFPLLSETVQMNHSLLLSPRPILPKPAPGSLSSSSLSGVRDEVVTFDQNSTTRTPSTSVAMNQPANFA